CSRRPGARHDPMRLRRTLHLLLPGWFFFAPLACHAGRLPGLAPLWGGTRDWSHTGYQLVSAPRTALQSLPKDAAWEGFIAPPLARELVTPAEYHGKLVLWGDITAAGHQSAGGVALWNGTQFEPVPPTNFVQALTVWNDQIVIATRAAGAGPMYIQALNGTRWDTLGTASNTVFAMTAFQNRLVAVGNIATVNGVTVNGVAAFDGAQWSGFGAGFPLPSNVPFCATVHAGELVVGGRIPAVVNIAKWNASASSWQTLGAGLTSLTATDGWVSALVTDGVSLFAAGHIRKSGSTPMVGVARWDGAAWNSIGVPSGAEPSSIALWNGKVVF